jgi:hypothetical protein
VSAAPTLADLQAQLACVTRVCTRLRRAYPRRADEGPGAAHDAAYELATLQGVAQTLRGLIEAHQLQLPLLAPSDRTP